MKTSHPIKSQIKPSYLTIFTFKLKVIKRKFKQIKKKAKSRYSAILKFISKTLKKKFKKIKRSYLYTLKYIFKTSKKVVKQIKKKTKSYYLSFSKFNFKTLKNNLKKIKFKIKLSYLPIGICLAFVAFIFVKITFFSSEVKAVLTKYDLYPKPETFTELYFEDHLNLPKVALLDTSESFKFTIHNLENQDVIYPYTVIIKDGINEKLIENNSVQINNNDFKTIMSSFSGSDIATRSAIVVTLVNQHQSIHFWLLPKPKKP